MSKQKSKSRSSPNANGRSDSIVSTLNPISKEARVDHETKSVGVLGRRRRS